MTHAMLVVRVVVVEEEEIWCVSPTARSTAFLCRGDITIICVSLKSKYHLVRNLRGGRADVEGTGMKRGREREEGRGRKRERERLCVRTGS